MFLISLKQFWKHSWNSESCVLFVYFILSAKFNFYSIIPGNTLYPHISGSLMFSVHVIPACLIFEYLFKDLNTYMHYE